MSAVTPVLQRSLNEAGNAADVAVGNGFASAGSVSASGSVAPKAGVAWPSPYLPIPFWMLVSNGHGWGWSFDHTSHGNAGSRDDSIIQNGIIQNNNTSRGNNTAKQAAGSKPVGQSPPTSVNTYL